MCFFSRFVYSIDSSSSSSSSFSYHPFICAYFLSTSAINLISRYSKIQNQWLLTSLCFSIYHVNMPLIYSKMAILLTSPFVVIGQSFFPLIQHNVRFALICIRTASIIRNIYNLQIALFIDITEISSWSLRHKF